jgi:hypothetical protein
MRYQMWLAINGLQDTDNARDHLDARCFFLQLKF